MTPGTTGSGYWILFASIGGVAGVVLLLGGAIAIFLMLGLNSQNSGGNVQRQSPAAVSSSRAISSRSTAPAETASSVPVPAKEAPKAAEPVPPSPPAKPVDLSQGRVVSFAGGRFKLWVPSQTEVKPEIHDNKRDGERYDYYEIYIYPLPNGNDLHIHVHTGSTARHFQKMIASYQEVGKQPDGPLEAPIWPITYRGVAGYAGHETARPWRKAMRHRMFFHEDYAFSISSSGTEEEVISSEIEHCFQSLEFGSPLQGSSPSP